MDQRTYFSSNFLSCGGFQSIVESADYSTYEYGFSENFRRVIKKPFYAGLIAGDNAKVKRLFPEDLQDVACVFGYEPNEIAEYEAFALGFYISYFEDIAPAVKEFIEDEEDFKRIADYRNSIGESMTDQSLKNNEIPLGLIDALILVNSFVKDE